MPGPGFGSLDSMIKTIKNNANLLRRKDMFQVIKESGSFKKKEPYRYKKASAQQLADIKHSISESNKRLFIKKLFILYITAAIVGGAGYFIFAGTYKVDDIILDTEYPKSEVTILADEIILRTQYFDDKNKASEEILRYGKRNGQCLSWYPTGELYRTSEYSNDSLIFERYYYPSGGEIVDFHKRFPGDAAKVKILDRGMRKYTFYCSEGKIIPGTFKVSTK